MRKKNVWAFVFLFFNCFFLLVSEVFDFEVHTTRCTKCFVHLSNINWVWIHIFTKQQSEEFFLFVINTLEWLRNKILCKLKQIMDIYYSAIDNLTEKIYFFFHSSIFRVFFIFLLHFFVNCSTKPTHRC